MLKHNLSYVVPKVKNFIKNYNDTGVMEDELMKQTVLDCLLDTLSPYSSRFD